MNTESIIQEIDTEISRLEQVKEILSETAAKRSPGRPRRVQPIAKTVPSKPTKRVMSVEAKAKIAEAQRVRWAKPRKKAKKVVRKIPMKSAVAKKAPAKKSAAAKSAEIKA